MPRVLARNLERGTTVVVPNAICIGLEVPKPESGTNPPPTLVPLNDQMENVGWFSNVMALLGVALGPAGLVRADNGVAIPSEAGNVYTLQLGYEGCLPVSAIKFTVLPDGQGVNGVNFNYPWINDGARGSVMSVS